MFDIFIPEKGARKKNVRKGLTFSFSLLLHALLIAAVIVVPLLRAEADLPGFKSTEVWIVSPILPGVPPSGNGGRGRKIAKPGEAKPRPDRPRGPISLRAPIEVPATIEEEDPTSGISGADNGPGVPGGQGDGSDIWEMGKEIKTDEVNPDSMPITAVRAPRLIKRVSPAYPQLALLARMSGKVVIEASTDIYGRVKEARVISGERLFDEAALEAVRQWIYEPYYVNAIPRSVRFTVTITFSLETR